MRVLQAEWKNLVLINYAIDPEILLDSIPSGTALELWNKKCYLSLVGFMFRNTRFLGLKIPFHTHFEEVNLRFYVTRDTETERKRGVVFIREIVPKPALTFVANTFYREHYKTLPMKHEWAQTADAMKTQYSWKCNSRWNRITVHSESKSRPIEANSEVEFITEHYWGYVRVNSKTTFEYKVIHPRWEHYPVKHYEINVSFSDTYGERFGFLDGLKPESVMLAKGSEVVVESRRKLIFSSNGKKL